MTPNIQPLAWMPDADPTQPGIIAEVENLLPTVRGYAPDYALANSYRYTLTLPSRVFSASSFARLGLAPGLLFGTADNLYFADSSTLTLRSRAAPYASINEGYEWRFAQFKDVAIATTALNPMQATTNVATTNFSDLAGAPRANTLCVQRNFVIAASFLTGSWPYLDGWWCSAQEDHTDWTPDIATQAAQGRLTATSGGITRLIPYQDTVIAFKPSSMYRGVYTGPTGNTWSFPLLSKSIGLAAHDAVCEANGALYWMGNDGFYRYSGGAPERIASAPWEYAKAIIKRWQNVVLSVWDPVRRCVRWYLPKPGSGNGTFLGIAYHVDTDRWGAFQNNACYAFSVEVESVPVVGKYSEFILSPIEWNTPGAVACIDATSFNFQTHCALPGASSLTSGDVGDDDQVTAMMRGRMRFLRKPTSSDMTHSYRMDLDDSLTIGATVARFSGKYDVSHAARWHRMKFSQTDMYEVTGFSVAPQMAGKR
jgi:hypothetical protein